MSSISIVSTLYRSQSTLPEFLRRIHASVSKLTNSFEIILVCDGCPEHSLSTALQLQESIPNVVIVELSRNFGHHPAIQTGLQHAQGDQVFLIDCDLEEDPEILEEFFLEMERGGQDVIFGVQEARGGSWLKSLGGGLFYRLFNSLSAQKIPENFLTVRLMSRRFVNAALQYGESQIFLGGLWSLAGFDQKEKLVEKHHRKSTSYSWRRRLSLFIDAITSFTHKPLLYVFYLGFFMASVSGILGLYLIAASTFSGDAYLAGWRSLVVSVWFIGGLTICCLGILGIYMSKIFLEVKRRPLTFVKSIHGTSALSKGSV